MTAVNGEHLKQLISRIENLEAEKSAIGEDVKSVYAEGKMAGYDVKIMRKIVAMKKKSEEERTEEETLIALYARAVGLSYQGELFDDERDAA